MDYFERAQRLLEIPLLKDQYEKQKESDRTFHEEYEAANVSRIVACHTHTHTLTPTTSTAR